MATTRVLLTGGGTGGHIYPALSIAAGLRERSPNVELLYIGTQHGLESRLVGEAGIPFQTVEVQGLVRKSLLEIGRGLIMLAVGSLQAWRLVRNFRPDVVVGTGGYVSGPVVAAAILQRRPVLLQEQNVVPGVTNRLLARFASRVAVAYDESIEYFSKKDHVICTGNPLRPELFAISYNEARLRLGLGLAPLVLVFAGSRGSATINRVMIELLANLPKKREFVLWYVSGEAHYDPLLHGLKERGIEPDQLDRVKLLPYSHNMPEVMAASDLVVTRAGAMALSELTALGKPAVLIPSPYVTHNHQEKNAAVLHRAGAAVVLRESELDAGRLEAVIQELIKDKQRRHEMAVASCSLGRPNALPDIVSEVLKLGASN